MSTTAVRTGLANRLTTVPNIQVSKYYPDQVYPPMLIVDSFTTTFDLSLGRGSDDMTWTLYAVVQKTSIEQASDALDALCPLVKAALEADKSLGGAARSLQVLSVSGYAPLATDDNHLAATFSVRVVAIA